MICLFPSTACILQDKLGAVNAVGFDINATCSGFLYSLYIADSLIKSRMHKRILVVGAEVLSRITDWEDRTTCVIFGDGAGAVIIEPTDEDREYFQRISILMEGCGSLSMSRRRFTESCISDFD